MNVEAKVDLSGFRLDSRPGAVLDVYFDEQRVFSVAPKSFTRQGSRFHTPWPRALEKRLKGCTQLVVKEHLTGDVLLDEPIHFDGSTERIRIRDAQGRPLAVDKFGSLVRMFTGADDATAQHLAKEVSRLVQDINAFGVKGFLAYGSLLGAVRNGKLIGHDTDTDTAYLSNYDHPADVAREAFALERFLVDRGWQMARMRVGLFRAVLHDSAGDARHIDIFTAIHDGTHLHLDPFVFAEIPLKALVPLGSVCLEGVDVPAPADPGAVLAATYGPSYLVPDPSFVHMPSRFVHRRSFALMGNFRLRRALWQRRMRTDWRNKSRPPASAFARRVNTQEPAGATIVDVGCGMGSDALWFARAGHRTIGIDYAGSSLRNLGRIARKRDLDAEFRVVSLYDLRATLAAATQLAAEPGDLVVYSRHLLDVLEPEGRANFWLLCRTALVRGGVLHVRFRTSGPDRLFRDVGFRPLDPNTVEAEAVARGARVVSRTDHLRATTMVLSWA